MKLIVLVGPPGSGKSTMAKTLESEGYTRINQDEQGKHEHLTTFEQALTLRKPIVIDRMNFNKFQRTRYLSLAQTMKYETEIIVLHESHETCLARCIVREGHPTVKTEEDANKALDFFFKNYERVEDTEADVVTRCWPLGSKPHAVICDLDGTLCNIDHRLHWVKGEGKKNWPMFLSGLLKDEINDWCYTIINRMSDAGLNVVLCSGRGDEYRKTTTTWLDYNEVFYNRLFMRQAGDHRQDFVVKEIILDFEILTRYTPYFAIDDRQQVVDMWRRRGVTCLQCAKGDF